jgi:hypothetical protein
MSDSHNLLSPLFDDLPTSNPLEPDEPHSDPVAASGGKARSNNKPRKDEKDPEPKPYTKAKPADPAANDQNPDSDSANVKPKDAPETGSTAHHGKNRENPPSASIASVAPPVNSPIPLIPSSSSMRKHRFKSQALTKSLPTITSLWSTPSASYSDLTSSSALTMPITTTHLATVTSFTYMSSVIVSNPSISPTLVNENVNASSGGSSDANIAVPVIISVLSGVFLIAMVVFVMSKMKQKRKNRETWSMYREEPWRNPFRESLDQYHSHY